MAAQAAVLFRIWVTADLRYSYAFFGSFLARNWRARLSWYTSMLVSQRTHSCGQLQNRF